MKAKRFTEEQIIAVPKEAEAGAKQYAGLTVSEARRLKELEAENSKLNERDLRRHRQKSEEMVREGL